MEMTQHEHQLITTRVEHGVLIVKIELNSLMHEMVINQVESSIMEVVPRAKTSLLVDCGELQLHVSSQFLSSLMCVYRNANARGTKLAVCNLSSTLKAGYEVTALTTLIPAFDSVEQAIEELKKLQAREIAKPEILGGSHPQLGTEPIRLSRTAMSLLIFAFLFFCSAAFMLGTIVNSVPPQAHTLPASPLVPFETTLTGTLTDAGDAADAWVVAWPVGYEPQSALTEADLKQLARSASNWGSLLSVTETAVDGAFQLPVRGFGKRVELHVLVLAKRAQGSITPGTANDVKALAGVIVEPLVASRRYLLMSDIVIRPHAVTDYRWEF